MRQCLACAVVGLVLATLAVAAVDAQNYAYVPDNNLSSGGSNSYPFRSTPTSWRYQMLHLAKYLPGKPVRITEMALAASTTSPPVFQASDFQIRMAHTTATTLSLTFAQNFGTPPVTVLNGAFKYQSTYLQWVDLGLQQGFLYDGTSNLVVEIRYRGRTSAGPSFRSDPAMHRTWNTTDADPYAATIATKGTTSYGLKTRFTYDSITLTLSGSPQPGGTVNLDMASPGDAGKPYQLASSLGTGPIPLGSRQIGLTPDNLMVITTGGLLPGVFVNFAGLLDAQGNARAQIQIPNLPALKGVRIYNAFVTLDPAAPFGISQISSTVTLSIL
jgi:hypothetical protein